MRHKICKAQQGFACLNSGKIGMSKFLGNCQWGSIGATWTPTCLWIRQYAWKFKQKSRHGQSVIHYQSYCQLPKLRHCSLSKKKTTVRQASMQSYYCGIMPLTSSSKKVEGHTHKAWLLKLCIVCDQHVWCWVIRWKGRRVSVRVRAIAWLHLDGSSLNLALGLVSGSTIMRSGGGCHVGVGVGVSVRECPDA